MSWDTVLLSGSFAALGFAAGLVFCALIMRSGIVDAPDGNRKTQARPIPRLGGLAIVLATIIATVIGFLILIVAYGIDPIAMLNTFWDGISQAENGLKPALLLTLAAFSIGLWDDIWGANTKLKLAVLSAACLALTAMGLVPDVLTSPAGDITLAPLLIVGSALWALVFINATNFMDGANGLAIGSLAIMLGGLALIGASNGDRSISVWWFPLFGAIAGFMMHNLRGNLYAGDAGALGLGALFAGFGLISGLEVWTVATLALPFLVDVLLTLIWRAKHGRHWLEAHLDHAYQRLIASGWTHLEAAGLYWGLSLTSACMSYIAARAGGEAPFVVFWTLFLAGAAIWIKHRRATKASNLGA